jgi:hypothetical protein
MVVAYLGVNVGVMVVTATLVASAAPIGLGLGLFGVLSIIRLRSTQLGQREVAYYFAALAIGALGGMGTALGPLALAGMALIVLVLAIADHPRVLPGYESQVITIPRAITDRTALVAYLESSLGGRVHKVQVRKLDFKKKTTQVEVRFSLANAANFTLPIISETDELPQLSKTLQLV